MIVREHGQANKLTLEKGILLYRKKDRQDRKNVKAGLDKIPITKKRKLGYYQHPSKSLHRHYEY